MIKYLFIAFCLLIILSSLYAEDIKIYTAKQKNNRIDFYCTNTSLAPYTIKISFKNLKNMKVNVELPYYTVIPGNSEDKFLFYIEPAGKGKWSYNYEYKYTFGDSLNTVHDENYAYLFPYDHGIKYKIVQGYFGKTTHKDSYALDFNLDIGDRIIASRGGLVISVKENSNIGGPSTEYSEYGNFITILHDDGSFAKYVHLKQNGAEVKPGQTVQAGEFIGYSGNTGRSSGPHLHFQVSIAGNEGNTISIPTKFLNYNGELIDPVEGKYYYSTHPGKPEYEIEFGEIIKDSDYKNYHEKVVKNNKIIVRDKRIDDVVLIFLQNGFNKKLNVTVTFTLTNLKSSKGKKIKIHIDPLSEIYLLHLKVIDGSKKWKYSYRYNYKVVSN